MEWPGDAQARARAISARQSGAGLRAASIKENSKMTASVIKKATLASPSEEFKANQFNGRVGTRLLSETPRSRLGNSASSG